MAKIASVSVGHYRIPLDTPLSDSTHGVMTAFELVTVRVRDTDGAEGTGYPTRLAAMAAPFKAFSHARSRRSLRARRPTGLSIFGIASGGGFITVVAAGRQCWPFRRSILRYGI